MAMNTQFQALQLLRQFIKDSNLIIDTEFTVDKSLSSFRTSVQIDGSIINFVPDSKSFSNIETQQILQDYLIQHLKKIQLLLEQMNSLAVFFQRMFYGISLGNGIAGALLVDIHDKLGKFHPFLSYLYEVNPYLVNLFWFIISSAIGGLIFHYLIQPLIWRFIAKKVREKF